MTKKQIKCFSHSLFRTRIFSKADSSASLVYARFAQNDIPSFWLWDMQYLHNFAVIMHKY